MAHARTARELPKDADLAFLTKKAGKTIYERTYSKNCWLIFGKETRGLPDDLIQRFSDSCVRIPMFDARVRSLNLSNAVAVTVYELVRQWET